MTPAGLEKQRLPLIALVAPGHWVLVEAVSSGRVRVWDPSGGSGQALVREYSRAEWGRAWSGVVLSLE